MSELVAVYVLTAEPYHDNSALVGARTSLEAAQELWAARCTRVAPPLEVIERELLMPAAFRDPRAAPVWHSVDQPAPPHKWNAWATDGENAHGEHGLITQLVVC